MENTNSIVILGAGEVGSAAAYYASKLDRVSSVCVADYDLGRAEQIASKVGRKGYAEKFDASCVNSISRVVQGAGYVLNCVGPYYKYACNVFESALASGTTYLDVNDDWEPTLELLKQDSRAKQSGVLALVGMGASPGISNLLARLVMNEIPDAVDLITAWREDNPATGYSAAKEHWLLQCSGKIKVFEDGRYVMRPPLQKIVVDFPAHGNVTLSSVGHPEPITLPRIFTGIKSCINAMACPSGIAKALERARDAIDSDLYTVRQAAECFEEFRFPDDDLESANLPGLFALARNAHAQQAIAVLTQYPDGLGPITASPMVAALSLLLNSREKRVGVLTPEEIFEPNELLDEYASVAGISSPAWEVII